MDTEKTKDRGNKAGCADFGPASKGFQEMFEKMSAKMGTCCSGQDGSVDCSTMMSGMMKGMAEMCCGPKTDETKTDSGTKTEETKGDSAKS